MGNSPKVSQKHYRMLLPEHFERLKFVTGTREPVEPISHFRHLVATRGFCFGPVELQM